MTSFRIILFCPISVPESKLYLHICLFILFAKNCIRQLFLVEQAWKGYREIGAQTKLGAKINAHHRTRVFLDIQSVRRHQQSPKLLEAFPVFLLIRIILVAKNAPLPILYYILLLAGRGNSKWFNSISDCLKSNTIL